MLPVSTVGDTHGQKTLVMCFSFLIKMMQEAKKTKQRTRRKKHLAMKASRAQAKYEVGRDTGSLQNIFTFECNVWTHK